MLCKGMIRARFDGTVRPAIWDDRAGFEEALATWADAVDAAIAANPQTASILK